MVYSEFITAKGQLGMTVKRSILSKLSQNKTEQISVMILIETILFHQTM